MTTDRRTAVLALGSAQTLAWASSYYLPAMLATSMAQSFDTAPSMVFAAFSVALVVSALLGPRAGRAIDRWGGKPVLAASNLLFMLGLTTLGLASSLATFFAGWVIIGVGMGSGLYEAAFSSVVRLFGTQSRGAITGITLIAGFASTVGWPLSSLLDHHYGWRGACFSWAALHLLLGLPLNLSLPSYARGTRPAQVDATESSTAEPSEGGSSSRIAISLSFVFAVTWFVSTAMAAQLPRLLQFTGASLAAAVTAGALVGPAQVGARLLEYGFLRRLHPSLSARLACVLHPVGAVVLATTGAAGAPVFGVLHGAGNGILTIAKGTLPLALFGPEGYGHRQGVLMVPARIAQAFAPLVFGACLDRLGAGALWVSTILSLSAFAVLLSLPRVARTARPVSAGSLEPTS